MEKNFNYDVAADVYDLVCKMDDDTAYGFIKAVNFDLLTNDLYNNRRAVQAEVERISKAIDEEVRQVIAKRKTDDHWRYQPRDEQGQWTVMFTRTKRKGTPDDHVREINVTQALNRGGEDASRFAQHWNKPARYSDSSSTAQTFSRIEAGSKLAGNIPNAKAKAAAQLGEQIGRYGPEAEKVIGPTLRRTAYRYRGTERAPDKDLLALQRKHGDALMRNEGLRQDQFGVPERFEASTKAAIEYLNGRLPSKGLSGLQQASGKIPPSEGVILNADGKIITQAVGYSDDHYLPFNLKNLKGLQGGSYIRSRSSGGPTTEDIYTGLMSGARSVTVVSRSGIFTVNFDDEFRGGRRYNDKAVQMVDRYAKTLDAVKSKQVTRRSVTPEEKAQIRADVEAEMTQLDATQEEIETEIQRKVNEFKVSNIPTKAEMDQINRKALEAASMGGKVKTGSTVGVADRASGGIGIKQESIPDDLKGRFNLYRTQLIDDLMESKASRQYQLDGEGYAAALDALREQFPYYIDSVTYIHRKNAPDALKHQLSPETDAGYVKPKYIRPEGAKEGYYDKTINASRRTGNTGKISADRTNYQNWPHNPENRDKEYQEAETEHREVSTPAAPAASGAASARERARVMAGARSAAASYAGQDAALTAAAKHYYASAVQDAATYKTLTQAKDDDTIRQLLKGPRRAELISDLEKIHANAGADPNPKAQELHRAAEPYFTSYQAAKNALGGAHWDPTSYVYGESPSAPFKFNYDERGGAYAAGQEYHRYEREADALVKKSGLSGISLQSSDDDLRSAAEFFGSVVNALSEDVKPEDSMIDVMRAASRLPEDVRASVNPDKVFNALQNPEARESMLSQSKDRAEAMERLRAVKLMSTTALHGAGKEAAAAADTKAIEQKTQVFDSNPKVRDPKSAIAEVTRFTLPEDHPDYAAAEDLAIALRDDDPAEINATLDGMEDPGVSGMFRQVLRKHGYDV